MTGSTVFLFDVDNTLIDNDRAKSLIGAGIRQRLGGDAATRFWRLYERVRAERDMVDWSVTIERFERALDPSWVGAISDAIAGCDFASLVYPGALAALSSAGRAGLPVLFSDGEGTYQRQKIRRAGLEAVVEGRVLVYPHKERELDDVEGRFGGSRYVVIDDKPRILGAIKAALGPRVTTVLVEQGSYGADAASSAEPDVRLPSIAAFAALSEDAWRPAHAG